MTLLTARGSFAQAYTKQFEAEVVSILEVGEREFIRKISKANTIIHNAATINCTDIDACIQNNFDFTRFLVDKIRVHNPNVHLVYISSMSILDSDNDRKYGDVLKMTPYSYSKYLSETYCLNSTHKRLSCVRFSTLFYKNKDKDGLSKMIYEAATKNTIRVINNGENKRNFIPIEIATRYVHKVTGQKNNNKHTYNIVSEKEFSFKEIAEILINHKPTVKLINAFDNVPKVLSQFHVDGIKTLGIINYSLEEEILKYLHTLNK